MLDIQTTQLQRVFPGRNARMADATEIALHGNDERSAVVVDVLKTTLLFAAIGSLLTAIALMLV